MTYLRVNRLNIFRRGKSVYDQLFSHPVNIIRGENGSGKSTIANFIYYSLGGDFIEWLPEARSCDTVFVEVEINNNILTLKREVVDKIMQPMYIFLGSMENALKSAIEGWEIYGYRKNDNKESFSQFLLRALEFPEVTTDNNESITLNQILRVLYIDQISPLNTLIKNVDFDSPLIRQAIGYLLLGIYDDAVFRQQIELRNKKRQLADLEREFNAVRDVYKNSNQTVDLNLIDEQIKDAEIELGKIDSALKDREFINGAIKNKEEFTQVRELQIRMQNTSKEIRDILNDISRIQAEIIDSQEFIDELNKQLAALHESLKTRDLLGEISVSYCPSCLTKINPTEDEELCSLCKEKINKGDHESRIFRIQRETESQIKESDFLMSKRRDSLTEKENQLTVLRKRLSVETKDLNSYIERTSSKLERKNDELLIRKGELRNQISYLLNQKQLITSYLDLQRRLNSLRSQVANLDTEVKTKEEIQRKKVSIALERIQHYSIKLLKGDGNYEDGFVNAARVVADFAKNSYAVNERNNFSASSLVILKNSIRFGIFFASLELSFMRYPRFILSDNMEDKGMREERSHNFQKNVVELANSFSGQYQIIFTTSMIDNSLDIPEYTVGDYYTPTNKSLKVT